MSSSRLGLIIWNGPVSSLYVSYATTVNPDTNVVVLIPATGTWVMPVPVYRGSVSVMRSSGTGRAVLTELK